MINILPLPTTVVETNLFQQFKYDTNVFCAPNVSKIAQLLVDNIIKVVASYIGQIIPFSSETNNLENYGNGIYFIQQDSFADECYELKISAGKIIISAANSSGFFYGCASLIQLFPTPRLNDIVTIPQVTITDSPKYSWRGLLFDESRNFFGKEEVMRIIDLLSEIKINKFHWHLTDDQGFRLQLDCYPELSDIGSHRDNTQLGGFYGKKFSNEPYSGFYTKDDIREVLEFAALRAVEIIPEIDMPSHSTAMLAALPCLQCEETQLSVATTFSKIDNLICPAKPIVFDIINNILTEVCELFPSKYIHLGGNDVNYKNWETCPICIDYMAANNLTTHRQLLGQFFNRVNSIVSKLGKQTIIYSSAYSDNLNEDIIIQYNSITQLSETVNAYDRGRKVIISPPSKCYLDYPNAFLDVSKIYKSSIPTIEFLPDNGNILGLEAAVWSEWIYDREKIDVCLFPRMHAIAEKAWSTTHCPKDLKSFIARVQFATQNLKRKGVNYYAYYDKKPSQLKRMIIRWQYIHKDQYREVIQNRKYTH